MEILLIQYTITNNSTNYIIMHDNCIMHYFITATRADPKRFWCQYNFIFTSYSTSPEKHVTYNIFVKFTSFDISKSCKP